jgi:dTDP-4-amino-4,6-dideoxygalactose transaminase
MAASATAILHWNAIPVFADIEPETFNIDPESILKNITPQTRAIMAVDIFGQSCDIDRIMDIADEHGLKVIGDTAQAPDTFNKGRVTGTLAHVGGYSLNYHKHIHTGEGGILVTNDDVIAERLQLIRNHAEAVVAGKGVKDLSNMIGHNFRLGEIEAAIGIEQLKKLRRLVESRQKAAEKLTKGLKGLPGLRLPIVKEGCTHAYYMYPMVLDPDLLGATRSWIYSALEAEGIQGLAAGYTNVHRLPIYQKKIAYGRSGFPWTADFCKRNVNYAKGICPIAEDLHDRTYLGFEMCMHALEEKDIELIIGAFKKVWHSLK